MQQIESPDIHHLRGAIGWLELGCRTDALAELDLISEGLQLHPDVLEARWMIFAEEKNWPAALQVAGNLVQHAPDRASGWLHRAYAVRRAPGGGLEKAWDVLRPAADKFSGEPVVFYNLSCYACQLNRLDEARDWLKRAIQAGKKSEIKEMALADEDLKSLWTEIEKW